MMSWQFPTMTVMKWICHGRDLPYILIFFIFGDYPGTATYRFDCSHRCSVVLHLSLRKVNSWGWRVFMADRV